MLHREVRTALCIFNHRLALCARNELPVFFQKTWKSDASSTMRAQGVNRKSAPMPVKSGGDMRGARVQMHREMVEGGGEWWSGGATVE